MDHGKCIPFTDGKYNIVENHLLFLTLSFLLKEKCNMKQFYLC